MDIIENIFFTLVVIAILVRLAIPLWELFKDREAEAKCPNCGKLWAAQYVREKLLGIFQKTQLRPIRANRFPRENDYAMAWYEKYEIHYRYKYCSHEWTFVKSRRQ